MLRYINIKTILILTILWFGFLSCSSSSRYNFLSTDNTETPDWLYTLPESSLNIYFVYDSTFSSAISIDEAVQNAIGELTNQLPYVISQSLLEYINMSGNNQNGELIFSIYRSLPEISDNILGIIDIVDGWKYENRRAILIKVPLPELTQITSKYVQSELNQFGTMSENNFSDWLLLQSHILQTSLNK